MILGMSAKVEFKFSAAMGDARRVLRAIGDGLNEGGDKVRTQVQKALWKQTGVVKYTSVTKRMHTLRASQATGGGLRYQIIASGKGIPIKEFKVSAGKSGVVAFPWAVEHDFKRSFALSGARYKARVGAARFPIRSLFGPSLPKELVKEASAATFLREAEREVPAAILKRLARLLQ